MKKRRKNLIKRAAAMILISVMTCAFCAVPASAAGGTVTVIRQRNGLTLTVVYPENIKFGEPVKFSLSGSGGTGEYAYKWGNVNMYINGVEEPVLDGAGFESKITNDPDFYFTFYAPGRYNFTFYLYDRGENYGNFMSGRFDVIVPDNDPSYPTVERLVQQAKEECLKNCRTDFEKALFMHDLLLKRCDYDYTYFFDGPEGALARGKGTCEAYHRAYVMLLQSVGMETGRITGNYHVWTAVKMDGKWYQVDLTWDASCYGKITEDTSDDYEMHMYFGVTDDMITQAHSDHKPVAGYVSTSLENNYFIKTGEIRTWADAFNSDIQTAIESGRTSFSLSIPRSNIQTAYYKYMYPIVAYYLSNKRWSADGKAAAVTAQFNGGEKLDFTVDYDVTSNPGGGEIPDDPDEPNEESLFADVKEGDYFYNAVEWAVENKITAGTTKRTFSPYDRVDRAQAVTFLWRAAGCPAPMMTQCPFSDVDKSKYYYKAVLWAVENGITYGTSPTEFSPSVQVDRAQAVSFLWRAAGKEDPRETASAFKDVKTGDYCYNAVLWAVEKGVAYGTAPDAFSPKQGCTRGQAVTFLYRANNSK